MVFGIGMLVVSVLAVVLLTFLAWIAVAIADSFGNNEGPTDWARKAAAAAFLYIFELWIISIILAVAWHFFW